MKQKKKQARRLGKRKWSALRGSKYSFIIYFLAISFVIIVCALLLIIDAILTYFLIVLFCDWMENLKTYQRLQLTSLRMCLCSKAWRGKKSSSTSEGSTR